MIRVGQRGPSLYQFLDLLLRWCWLEVFWFWQGPCFQKIEIRNSVWCPLFAYIRGANISKLGTLTMCTVQSQVVKQVGNLTISDLVEMHSQRLESDRRGELNSTVEKKGFVAPVVKLLRPCTMIISNYTEIIMYHFLLQIITINSLNRTHEQPFDSVLVLCSALCTWILMMLYQ